MAPKRIAKTQTEELTELIATYKKKYGGEFRMEHVADWILENRILPPPQISARRLLTRMLKQAARRKRTRDVQGRTVRELIAAKVERIDTQGNLVLDVVWDYLHTTSSELAYQVFFQRNESIEKQRVAATREVLSFLDNNPNAIGHEEQFQFPFMVEETHAEAVQVVIAESAFAARGLTHSASESVKPR